MAFAWCIDEDLRLSIMFPEHMAYDTTFGVTKEQKNLFVVDGIDGNNKVFTTMRCFMTSKETKVYYWVMRTDLRHLVTDKILSFNQCISCDQDRSLPTPRCNAGEYSLSQ